MDRSKPPKTASLPLDHNDHGDELEDKVVEPPVKHNKRDKKEKHHDKGKKGGQGGFTDDNAKWLKPKTPTSRVSM